MTRSITKNIGALIGVALTIALALVVWKASAQVETVVGIGYQPPPNAVSRAGYKLQAVIPDWEPQPFNDAVALSNPPSNAELLSRYGPYALHGYYSHANTAEAALRDIAKIDPGWFERTGRGRARGWEPSRQFRHTVAGHPSQREILDAAYCDPDLIHAAAALRWTVAGDPTPESPGRWRAGWAASEWVDLVRRQRRTSRWWGNAMSEEMAELILDQVRERVAFGDWPRPRHVANVRVLYGDADGNLSDQACEAFLAARVGSGEWGLEELCQ